MLNNIKQEDHYLSSVKNALRIIKSFTMDEPEKRVSDLSASLSLSKSSVSRMMATLASEGFVSKDPETHKYRLGLSILTLSGIINTNMDIYQESQPILNKLVENIGETAHISILDNLDVIYLLKVECKHPVRFLTHIGKRNPPYSTSSGKVMLAYSNMKLVEQVLERGLHKFTKNTISTSEKLYAELKQIREDGYSFSIEEFTEGVTSIAAPVFDYRGNVIAALSVVGPKQRIPSFKIHVLAKKVMEAAMEISNRMGYRR